MSVKDLTDPQILEHLKKNTLLRNKQLTVLVKLLNSLKEPTTFAIDGAWGSGKTVFVKQLLMLADDSVKEYGNNTLDKPSIEKLREDQKAFYFNAWENDYTGDALGAILLKLIAADDPSLSVESIKRGLSMINPSAGIREATKGWIDPDKKPAKDELVEHIKSLVDRHDAVNDFIDAIKGDKTRLIFIVDELDRCKPSFAVDLLEVIKHYFVRDDVTFIVTANLKELSHTIKKYYGHEFDGYAYLNKFFNFTFGLLKVNEREYAKNILDWHLDSSVDGGVAWDAIRYYKFEMREINAYSSALQLIVRFLTKSNNYRQEQYSIQLIFVPLALALKIKSNKDYEKFTSGGGEDVLRNFLTNTTEAVESIASVSFGSSDEEKSVKKQEALEELVVRYKNLFSPDGRRGGHEDLENFSDAIALIGSYATIIEEKAE